MPERRHHAATLKVKTLQSARQPAMQVDCLTNVPESVHHRLSDCQTPPGCRMLATQTCSSSRILALPTNGVETSCTREMRSSLVTQVEGCMKFGSPRGQDDVSHDLDWFGSFMPGVWWESHGNFMKNFPLLWFAVFVWNDFETSIFPMRLTYRNSIQNASGSLFGSETACDWIVNMSQIQQMAMMSHVTVSGTIFTASGTYRLEVMHLDLKGRLARWRQWKRLNNVLVSLCFIQLIHRIDTQYDLRCLNDLSVFVHVCMLYL